MKAGSWTARNIPNDPENISGGYLLEVGVKSNWLCSSRFICGSGWKVTLKEPADASPAQVEYIFRLV